MSSVNVLECPKMDWSKDNREYSFSCPMIKWRGYIPELRIDCQITFNICESCKYKNEQKNNVEKEGK